jgi:hypothetical protein
MKMNNDMPGRWLFKVVPWFIGFVFVLILLYWIVVGVILVKSADAINEQGLRGVIERIWCGKEAKDCQLPSPNK